MSKCDKCSKSITKRNPGLECNKCEKIVHGNTICSGLTNKQLAALRAVDNLEWTCHECLNTSTRRSSYFVPEEDDDDNNSQDMRINLKQLATDMTKEIEKAIQREMKEFMKSLQYQSDKMDEVIETLEFCKESIQELKRKNIELTNKNLNLESRLGALEQRLQENEQEKLGNQIEIFNVPCNGNEEAKSIVEKIANKLQVTNDDVIHVQTKQAKKALLRKETPGRILVEVKNEETQNKWITAAKKMQNFYK